MRFLLPVLALVAACARDGLPPPLPERPDDSCLSAPYRRYVGQPVWALDDVFVTEPSRFLWAGDPVGSDYNPIRINFDIGADSTIRRVWCG